MNNIDYMTDEMERVLVHELLDQAIAATSPSTPKKKATAKPADAFKYPIGMELTAMSPMCTGKTHSSDSDLAGHYAGILEIVLDNKKIKYDRCFRDIRCVEVTSGVVRSWTQLETFYKGVMGEMTALGLQPHVENLISGGGHIHVSGMKPALMVNLVRDIQNRPYLNWCFNEPDDSNTHTSASDLEDVSEKLRLAAPKLNVDLGLFVNGYDVTDDAKTALVFYGNPEAVRVDYLPDCKSKQCRYKDNIKTLEFRFFRAPVDWEEQVAHVKFVEAYINHIEETTKPIDVVVNTPAKVKAFTQEKCKAEFIELLTTLKLDHAPYIKIMEDNLEDRFKRGTRK